MPTDTLLLPFRPSDESANVVLDLGEYDVDALLFDSATTTADDGEQPFDLSPSSELREVTRRIAAQFLDVLHVTASGLFAGRDPRGSAAQLVTALDALDRLAVAARDDAHRATLAEIHPHARAFAENPAGRARHRFLARLRPWLVHYAAHLSESDGARIRQLVAFDIADVPLFAELSAIPGIGPRRLERLFCAGLYAVEVVSAADPAEVAQVTGLPRVLAADVVTRAGIFAEERRRRCVLEMRARLAEFQRVFGSIDRATNPELWDLARSAVTDLQNVAEQYRQEPPQ
ncbi:MAG: helix-hairpin-helix domain-containing protein [Myxococcota bacterium]